MGTGIGVKGAIIPLIIGTVPFFSRQIELGAGGGRRRFDRSGAGDGRFAVTNHLPGPSERVDSRLPRATTITFISLIGLTAMAGVVGAGGLGDFTIRYGHQRSEPDVIWVTILIILIS